MLKFGSDTDYRPPMKLVIAPRWMMEYFTNHDGYAYSEAAWYKIENFLYKHNIVFCHHIMSYDDDHVMMVCSTDR